MKLTQIEQGIENVKQKTIFMKDHLKLYIKSLLLTINRETKDLNLIRKYIHYFKASLLLKLSHCTKDIHNIIKTMTNKTNNYKPFLLVNDKNSNTLLL